MACDMVVWPENNTKPIDHFVGHTCRSACNSHDYMGHHHAAQSRSRFLQLWGGSVAFRVRSGTGRAVFFLCAKVELASKLAVHLYWMSVKANMTALANGDRVLTPRALPGLCHSAAPVQPQLCLRPLPVALSDKERRV